MFLVTIKTKQKFNLTEIKEYIVLNSKLVEKVFKKIKTDNPDMGINFYSFNEIENNYQMVLVKNNPNNNKNVIKQIVITAERNNIILEDHDLKII